MDVTVPSALASVRLPPLIKPHHSWMNRQTRPRVFWHLMVNYANLRCECRGANDSRRPSEAPTQDSPPHSSLLTPHSRIISFRKVILCLQFSRLIRHLVTQQRSGVKDEWSGTWRVHSLLQRTKEPHAVTAPKRDGWGGRVLQVMLRRLPINPAAEKTAAVDLTLSLLYPSSQRRVI